MKHPGEQYGLLLTRKNTYIDLSSPAALFEGKRPFMLLEWSEETNRYMPWIQFSGTRFNKLNNKELIQLLEIRVNEKDYTMLPMNKFFKNFEDLKNWLGDYFVIFVDDLMVPDK